MESHTRFTKPLLEKCAETAKRCGAALFVSGYYDAENGIRNTTYAFDSKGQPAGHYYKQHLTPGEVTKRMIELGIDCILTNDYQLISQAVQRADWDTWKFDA